MAKCPKCRKGVSLAKTFGKNSYTCQHCGATPLVMDREDYLIQALLFFPFIVSAALARYQNSGWAFLSLLIALFYYIWWCYMVELKVEKPPNLLILTKVPGWAVFITIVIGLVFLFFIVLYYKYS